MGLTPLPKDKDNISFFKKAPFILCFFIGAYYLYQFNLGGYHDKRMMRREIKEAADLSRIRQERYEMRMRAAQERARREAEEREKQAPQDPKPSSPKNA